MDCNVIYTYFLSFLNVRLVINFSKIEKFNLISVIIYSISCYINNLIIIMERELN